MQAKGSAGLSGERLSSLSFSNLESEQLQFRNATSML
jgi:hypothetical protein